MSLVYVWTKEAVYLGVSGCTRWTVGTRCGSSILHMSTVRRLVPPETLRRVGSTPLHLYTQLVLHAAVSWYQDPEAAGRLDTRRRNDAALAIWKLAV